MAENNSAAAKRFYDYFNQRKLEEATALIPENFVIKNVPQNVVFKGKEGYKDFLHFWQKAFPDAKAEIANTISSGDYVVTEYLGMGTHNGKMETPTGSISPTGKKVKIPFCEVLRFKNGNPIESHIYFDINTIMQQLELIREKA